MPDWDSDVLQKAGRLENPRPLWITTLLWYLPAVKQSQAKPTWLSEQGYVKKKNQQHTYSSLSGLQVKTFTVLIL